MPRKKCSCERIAKNAPRTGVRLPPKNMFDGLHGQRMSLDGHLTKRRNRIIPPSGF